MAKNKNLQTIRVVYTGTSKKGTQFDIRYSQMEDVNMLLSYFNTLSQEKTYIRYQGEIIDREFEEKYLHEMIENVKNKKSIHLLVIHKDQVIGVSNLDMYDKTEKHVCNIGLSIAAKYRNEGIGRILLETIIEEGRKNIPNLSIITLCVFGNNTRARKIYEKAGFVEYGNLPGGIIHKDTYVDHVQMYKRIR